MSRRIHRPAQGRLLRREHYPRWRVLTKGTRRSMSEKAELPQTLPEFQPLIGVKFQKPSGRPAGRRDPPDMQSVPYKMACPLISARIEQARHFVSVGIEAAQVGAFSFVAAWARPS